MEDILSLVYSNSSSAKRKKKPKIVTHSSKSQSNTTNRLQLLFNQHYQATCQRLNCVPLVSVSSLPKVAAPQQKISVSAPASLPKNKTEIVSTRQTSNKNPFVFELQTNKKDQDNESKLFCDQTLVRPQFISEIVGVDNYKAIQKFTTWLLGFKESAHSKMVAIVTGPSGTGKTLAVELILAKFGYQINKTTTRPVSGESNKFNELNSSGETKTKFKSKLQNLLYTIGLESKKTKFVKEARAIIIDDISGEYLKSEQDPTSELKYLAQFIQEYPTCPVPIVCVTNSMTHKVWSLLQKTDQVEVFYFKALSQQDIIDRLQVIHANLNPVISEVSNKKVNLLFNQIALNANGDMRHAINEYQFAIPLFNELQDSKDSRSTSHSMKVLKQTLFEVTREFWKCSPPNLDANQSPFETNLREFSLLGDMEMIGILFENYNEFYRSSFDQSKDSQKQSKDSQFKELDLLSEVSDTFSEYDLFWSGFREIDNYSELVPRTIHWSKEVLFPASKKRKFDALSSKIEDSRYHTKRWSVVKAPKVFSIKKILKKDKCSECLDMLSE